MTTKINHSKAIFLVNSEVRAVHCVYEREPTDAEVAQSARRPKRVLFKTFDKAIKVGDIVVVPTSEENRHGFTTNKVVAVDVDVNHDDDTQVNWIVSRVDMDAYNKAVDMERKGLAAIRAGEDRRRTEQLRADMLAGMDAESIRALPMASKDVIDATISSSETK